MKVLRYLHHIFCIMGLLLRYTFCSG